MSIWVYSIAAALFFWAILNGVSWRIHDMNHALFWVNNEEWMVFTSLHKIYVETLCVCVCIKILCVFLIETNAALNATASSMCYFSKWHLYSTNAHEVTLLSDLDWLHWLSVSDEFDSASSSSPLKH